jgi:Leucine-rich repeat (LRR) protein
LGLAKLICNQTKLVSKTDNNCHSSRTGFLYPLTRIKLFSPGWTYAYRLASEGITMKRLALSLVLLYSTFAFATAPQTEVDALVALYNSTNGAQWNDNTNWLVGDPCDNSWFGITCDNSSGIKFIILFRNNLTGTIPSELGNLTNLGILGLSYNQLTGSIPNSLGNLTNLGILSLGNNQLTGSIPIELVNLTSLTQLRLFENQLTGGIPAELDKLTVLEELILDSNQLTGGIPGELGKWTFNRDYILHRSSL